MNSNRSPGSREDEAFPAADFDKSRLLQTLLTQVRVDLEALVRTQSDASDAATHEENRAEHAKDTRATEQSYLARGLAERVDTLRTTERRLSGLEVGDFCEDDAIGSTALVRLADSSQASRLCWLVPAGGGLELHIDGNRVQTLTPASPLGRALIGRSVGDEAVYESPGGTRHFEIVAIR
jgi:transcription elongation GreA/GreB family factor